MLRKLRHLDLIGYWSLGLGVFVKLSIYSLRKTLYDGQAKAINCQTTAGEITILNNHRPLISIVKNGVIKIIDEKDKEHFVKAISGFLEVKPENEARFIVEE
ncbi:MAG: ATP synthase epsilon chain [Parcubacteria group bacterium GW2011_GWF2_39_13b]|nr:MAG: ATP synthase epsilon chain [Parcubacteria group bacterium GW2011_GWF2_39_13b]